ncbi:MAG: carboxypeptidase regulatory-like domain-containing protein [Saprospiraceae bacterium]|nr:carboxypeptidase regulatory-like domain-containing protein [Pyrinomonadaceae bacterium]
MSFINKPKSFLKTAVALYAMVFTVFASMPVLASANLTVKSNSGLGVIKGMVRDNGGKPIADATVAIFRLGTSKILKQVRSASDGSFLARILPGTYTVLAVAEGFNPVTLAEVEVGRASQLNYGFKLERAGGGNTLPEKKLDRNNPKWVIRAAQTSRSIYQNREGDESVTVEETAEVADEESKKRSGQTIVETYFAASERGSYAGVNAATLVPLGEDAEIVFAGQAGVGKGAPQRFEALAKFRPADKHQVRLNTAISNLGSFTVNSEDRPLGQFSMQALDEWKVREGVIVVLGVDYSRFIGAGNDFSISPRLGFQLDVDEKTRFRTSYTTQTEERTWVRAIEIEDAEVMFRDPAVIQDLVVENEKPQMNKSRRFEFGIERVLDNRSSIEANAFFDATLGRGVSFTSHPFGALDAEGFGEFTTNQQGKTQGGRVVYSRRLSGRFSTSAGYSFGSGQRLSEEAVSNPAELFEQDFFQSFFGQFEADLKTGTNVKTIFRFSPQATVFAIDPFQGRLAIYDPGLSILVTQSLPTLGLPFEAEAVVDARNLFGFQTGVSGDEGGFRLNSQQRALRGGILVRF